ncbi:hypothetical protein [Haladaptatus sp. CMSO5]|uniref:hypothetical protein n=1 Tax=Haladaptatus sp. CMSO5 TaxID=3120514 RepID=UPI002FCE25E2
MTPTLTRRTFLAFSGTAFAATFAGCTGFLDDEPATVTVENGFDREIVVTVEVHHSTDESLAYEETIRLATGESQQMLNPMDTAGSYEIHVIVEDTFDETYSWTVSENGAPSLYLDIRPHGMELSDAGR